MHSLSWPLDKPLGLSLPLSQQSTPWGWYLQTLFITEAKPQRPPSLSSPNPDTVSSCCPSYLSLCTSSWHQLGRPQVELDMKGVCCFHLGFAVLMESLVQSSNSVCLERDLTMCLLTLTLGDPNSNSV